MEEKTILTDKENKAEEARLNEKYLKKPIQIDENGDISIPEEIWDYLGIKVGDKVWIESTGNETFTISKP